MMPILIRSDNGQNTGIFESIDLWKFLRQELRIYAKPVGSLPHSLQNKLLGPPFLINDHQLQYLKELNKIDFDPGITGETYEVFREFTRKGYMLKDGMKFGCNFVGYPGDPLYCHATLMIVVTNFIGKFRLVELGRIAHDTQKELVMAWKDGERVEIMKLAWMSTGAR
jgi:tRNA splicing endonuclease